ncbi:putative transposase [Nitrobacter sp. Nb-311A]|nr:putative transposase [Nitrobacter sp. Nb-311A]
MERTQIFDLMGELKLYGMRAAFDEIMATVVKHGRQIVPAPAGDLEVGKIRLPELGDGGGLVLELVRRFDHHIGRAGDEVMRLQQSIDRSLRETKYFLSSVNRTASSRGDSSASSSARSMIWPIRDAIPGSIRSRAVI